ncbi:MAG: DUF4352 domain-containing protein [Bryobacterales bacterium]|nr:DUF4352 domain-containing protein [Bryobacterales bacterium]
MRHIPVLRVAGLALSLILAGCGQVQTPEIKTHPLGERVTVGYFTYQVFENQWLTRLGEGQDVRTPNQRFMSIRVSVTNGGASAALVPPLALVDDRENSHPEVPSVTSDPNWLGFNRNVRPAETAQGNIVFDVAPGHYRLRLADNSEQERYAYVDIPFRYERDTITTESPSQ